MLRPSESFERWSSPVLLALAQSHAQSSLTAGPKVLRVQLPRLPLGEFLFSVGVVVDEKVACFCRGTLRCCMCFHLVVVAVSITGGCGKRAKPSSSTATQTQQHEKRGGQALRSTTSNKNNHNDEIWYARHRPSCIIRPQQRGVLKQPTRCSTQTITAEQETGFRDETTNQMLNTNNYRPTPRLSKTSTHQIKEK